MDRVNLSVLDRLINLHPRGSSELPLTHAQSARLYRESVRRDIEWLLNTRRLVDLPPENLVEVNRSVYVYGLPDFTSWSVANPQDRKRLLRELHATIRLFEPRLSNPRLIPLEDSLEKTRTVRFRIEAMLIMDPAPERIAFDTVLQLANGEYEVRDAG
jgi:type VI secretion system protein ImpF